MDSFKRHRLTSSDIVICWWSWENIRIHIWRGYDNIKICHAEANSFNVFFFSQRMNSKIL